MNPNQFLHKVAPSNLSTAVLTVTAGGVNQEVIAAVAGKAIRVWGAMITQKGTAAGTFTLDFDGGKKILQAEVPNTGVPVYAQLNGHYIQDKVNQAVDVDVEDQAADDAQVTVWYTLEDI